MEDDGRLGACIQFLGRKLDTNGNILLKDMGITVMQLRVMRYIRTHPDETQIADIAEYFGVKHTSTIHVVCALEEKGCLYREPIRRSRGKKIKLTSLGETIADQNESKIDQMEEIMLAGFSEEEKKVFFSFLNRINDNLDKEFQ